MEEWRRKKIEDVYAKWEKKGSRPGGARGGTEPQPATNKKSVFSSRQLASCADHLSVISDYSSSPLCKAGLW